jgi:four helix bundle protein
MNSREIHSFRDLDAWAAGMELAVAIYNVAKLLPSSERFEMSAQLRRAAVSVPSNVAEGHEHRNSPKTYAKHVRIALGSLAELETDLEIAIRVQLLSSQSIEDAKRSCARTGQLLNGLLRSCCAR